MTANSAESAESSTLARGVHVAGRVLFGGVLTALGASNLRNNEDMVAYAKSKDVPAADLSVPFASALLTAGGVGVALWRRPALAAAAVTSFLVSVTPTMHDFWNLDGQERETEQTNFLQNAVILGAALAFVGRALGRGERA